MVDQEGYSASYVIYGKVSTALVALCSCGHQQHWQVCSIVEVWRNVYVVVGDSIEDEE